MTDTNHHVLTGKVDITSNLLVGSSHLFVDTNNNRVGLITTNPDAGLHVNSNAYVNTDLRVGSQIEINATAGRVKAASFEGDGSLLENIPAGADGAAATIGDPTITTGLAGTDASVTNSGTSSAAVFDFVIPRGDQGPTGATGAVGNDGADGTNYFELSGSDIYRTTGRVGIGVTNPTSNLHVVGSTTIGTTKTFVVTVASVGGGNRYHIDGVDRPVLQLHQHQTYIFDVSSLSAGGHVFAFSTTAQGTHGGGSEYNVGVSRPTNQLVFDVPVGAPSDLYYYCTTGGHASMGSDSPSKVYSTAELIVSGRVVPTDLHVSGTGGSVLGGGTTSQRPTNPLLGMIRYNTTTGFMETYTAVGWGSIAPPPTVTGISPSTVTVGDTATQVFTVTGTGITNGSTVQLEGADGTLYDGFNVTTPNATATQITFKMGALGTSGGYDVAQKPYKVKINVTSGLSVTSTNTITFSPPTITSLSNNTLADSTVTGSTTITVNGTGFTSSMTGAGKVMVLGADGSTLYAVNSVAVASTTQLTFNLGASLSSGQLANRPYKVRVTGASGLAATSTQTIGFAGLSWSSPASNALLEYAVGTSSTQNLIATDEVGGSDVTFSIFSGSVSGLSLGSASASPATYGGNATTGASEVPVTFRVTDNVTGSTLDRTFRISVISELFPFTSHTFTSVGLTGKTGPSIVQLRNNYSTAWDGTDVYFNLYNSTTGFQLFTIPEDGNYLIDAKGAEGGRNITGGSGYTDLKSPGQGAHVSARFYLTKGTKIVMIVGQTPTTMASYNKPYGGGGGGATWVLKPGAFTSSNDVYLVAGAGGGAGTVMQGAGHDGGNANGSSQGTLGSGGTSIRCKGAGAGWTSMGGGVDADGTLTGGYHPAGGAHGGDYDTSNEFYAGQYSPNAQTWASAGGFGGGGGNCNYSPGGGAGASGGSHTGNSWADASVGGTSYIMPNGTGGVTVSSRVFYGNTTSPAGVYIEKLP